LILRKSPLWNDVFFPTRSSAMRNSEARQIEHKVYWDYFFKASWIISDV